MRKNVSSALVVVFIAAALTSYAAAASKQVTKPAVKPAKPAPTKPAAPVQYGLAVRIVIMPPPHASVEQIKRLQPLADAIANQSQLYVPWVYDSGNCKWGKCTVSDADLMIETTQNGDALRFDSFDMRANQPIGSASVASTDALKSIPPGDVQQLLGTPKIAGKNVLIDAQYVQYIQIVPQTSADTPYIALVQHLLARQGFAAFPSQYTYATLNGAGDVTSICAHGERYFIYTVNTSTDPKKWIGFTRIASNANGFLADCVTHVAYRFAGESTRSVPTSSATFAGLAAILKLGFLPHFDWGDIGTATTAVATFGDVDPTSSTVQYPVIETSLQKSVDLMCDVISHSLRRQATRGKNATFDTVTAKNITVQNLNVQSINGQSIPAQSGMRTFSTAGSAGNQPSGTGAAPTAAAPQLAFDISAVMGPEPFPLECSGPRINVPPTPRPEGSGIFGSFTNGDS